MPNTIKPCISFPMPRLGPIPRDYTISLKTPTTLAMLASQMVLANHLDGPANTLTFCMPLRQFLPDRPPMEHLPHPLDLHLSSLAF